MAKLERYAAAELQRVETGDDGIEVGDAELRSVPLTDSEDFPRGQVDNISASEFVCERYAIADACVIHFSAFGLQRFDLDG